VRIPYCDISLHFLFYIIKTNDSKKLGRIIATKWRHGAQNPRQLEIYNLRLNLKVKINETENPEIYLPTSHETSATTGRDFISNQRE
jgi:hypothetical protein